MPWNKGPWPRFQGQDGFRMLRRKISNGRVGDRPLRNTVGEVMDSISNMGRTFGTSAKWRHRVWLYEAEGKSKEKGQGLRGKAAEHGPKARERLCFK